MDLIGIPDRVQFKQTRRQSLRSFCTPFWHIYRVTLKFHLMFELELYLKFGSKLAQRFGVPSGWPLSFILSLKWVLS